MPRHRGSREWLPRYGAERERLLPTAGLRSRGRSSPRPAGTGPPRGGRVDHRSPTELSVQMRLSVPLPAVGRSALTAIRRNRSAPALRRGRRPDLHHHVLGRGRGATRLRPAAPSGQLPRPGQPRMGAEAELPPRRRPVHGGSHRPRTGTRRLGRRARPVSALGTSPRCRRRAGLIGAGAFVTDPISGYPPGTPDIPAGRSTSGVLHDLLSVPTFIGVPAAALLAAVSLLIEDIRAGRRTPRRPGSACSVAPSQRPSPSARHRDWSPTAASCSEPP